MYNRGGLDSCGVGQTFSNGRPAKSTPSLYNYPRHVPVWQFVSEGKKRWQGSFISLHRPTGAPLSGRVVRACLKTDAASSKDPLIQPHPSPTILQAGSYIEPSGRRPGLQSPVVCLHSVLTGGSNVAARNSGSESSKKLHGRGKSRSNLSYNLMGGKPKGHCRLVREASRPVLLWPVVLLVDTWQSDVLPWQF
jgi:hypothetical protein